MKNVSRTGRYCTIVSTGEQFLLMNHFLAIANFPASIKVKEIANKIADDKTRKSVIASPYNVGTIIEVRIKKPFLGSSSGERWRIGRIMRRDGAM